jgi:hypothetical protein
LTPRFAFGLLSYICEALILVYFGLSFDKFPKSIEGNIGKVVVMSVANFLIMLVMRFSTIFVLIALIRFCNRKRKLSLGCTEVSLVGFSGMIRGSIAYALVVKLADNLDPESPTLPYSVVIGQIVIALTMYIFTPLNPMLFRYLMDQPLAVVESVSSSPIPHNMISLGDERPPASNTILMQKREHLVNRSNTGCKVLFKRLDELVIKPLLIRDYESRVVS